jgi:thioesterase domain-containing protein
MSAMPYREVSRLLGPDQPVYVLESPVVLDAPVDLRTRATSYVAALRAALPPPYTLLGYSSGAWMALQMARQLCAEGAEVKQLVVFDAPVPRRLTVRDRVAKATQHLRWHLRWTRVEPMKELARLGRGVQRRLRRWTTGRIPEEQIFPTGSLYDLVDRRLRAAILAFSREHHPRWDGRITLILGEHVDYPYLNGELDLRLGWRQIAGRGLEVIRVSSDHLSMLEGAEAEHLASELRRLFSARP